MYFHRKIPNAICRMPYAICRMPNDIYWMSNGICRMPNTMKLGVHYNDFYYDDDDV